MSSKMQAGQTNTNFDLKYYFQRYLTLLIKRMWILIPCAAVVGIIWGFLVFKTGLTIPTKEVTAVLEFDDPKNLSAVEEGVEIDSEGKSALIKSRSFIGRVVDKLNLQLQVSKHNRALIFDSIYLPHNPLLGTFTLKIRDSKYKLSYTNKELGYEGEILAQGAVDTLRYLSYGKMRLHLSKEFLEAPESFVFSIVNKQQAVEQVIAAMKVKSASVKSTVMTISLKGRDYQLIKDIINTVADDFVNENSQTKKGRKKEVLEILEKQLQTAKAEMQESDRMLKAFREANPTVGIPDAIGTSSLISELQQTTADYRSELLQAQNLRERYRKSDERNKIGTLNEMIAFLVKYQTGTAMGLQTELNTLAEESQKLQEEYSPNHPLRTNNNNSIRSLGSKVQTALSDLIIQLSRKAYESENRIKNFEKNIAGLPAQEMQFASLKRKNEVDAQIYTAVLQRYNEAKIAEAVEIGDVYVIDHAVAPTGGTNLLFLSALLSLGFIFGGALGAGPIILIDYFDRRARSVTDLKRFTDLLVLESIPVKGNWKEESSDSHGKSNKLVSAEFNRDFVDETYRSLRTKLLLSLHDLPKKRVVITSLNMSEGKSLTAANLAITTAQHAIPTILIDGDLRRGIQHQNFGISKKPGLSNILLDHEPLTENYVHKFIQSSHVKLLQVLTCGVTVPNSCELINTQRFRTLLDILSLRYEMIIFDTPPLAVITDAVGVQDAFHKYIVVVRAFHTNIALLNRKVRDFPGLKRKILGIVFNGTSLKRPEYYQYTAYKY